MNKTCIMQIPFNKTYQCPNEQVYVIQALQFGRLSGNNAFSQKVQDHLESKRGWDGCSRVVASVALRNIWSTFRASCQSGSVRICERNHQIIFGFTIIV